MLPLVDKPIIQYGVEEAVAAGIDNIMLVTGRGKNAIEDHFDVSVELESFLEARGKRDQLEEIRKISNMINFAYVRQGEPLGLGHAVLVTRELVGDEPFAVILADDVIDADPPAIKQLIDVFDRLGGPVLAVERVPRDEISSYGVIAIEPNADTRRRDLPGARSGGEAAEGRSAVRPRDHRPLRADARHLSGAGGDQERSHRRDPADQRPARAAEDAADLRLRSERRPPRHRQQARVPEGGGLFRAAPARPRRQVLRVPRVARPAPSSARRAPTVIALSPWSTDVLGVDAAGAGVLACSTTRSSPDDGLLSPPSPLLSVFDASSSDVAGLSALSLRSDLPPSDFGGRALSFFA